MRLSAGWCFRKTDEKSVLFETQRMCQTWRFVVRQNAEYAGFVDVFTLFDIHEGEIHNRAVFNEWDFQSATHYINTVCAAYSFALSPAFG